MTIITGMSSKDYHAHPAISKSGLDRIAKSPAHYQAYLQGEVIETDAMIFGSAFHDYILSPDVFAQDYAVLPDGFDGRTKKGKELMEAIKADGKTVLKAEQVNIIKDMAKSIMAHEKASALLKGGQAESSIFWQDQDTEINCRCRPDYIHPSGILVDLKSTTDASPKEFTKSVANYRYHVQDAFYSEGYYRATGKWPRGFVFIAVEKTAPYAVACYELDEDAKEFGRTLFQRDISTLKQARTENKWTAYSPEIQSLSLPMWAYYQG